MSAAGREDAIVLSRRRPLWRQLLDKADRVLEAESLLPVLKCNGQRRRVLDLGCGLGYAAALWMDKHGPSKVEVHAVDLSPEYLRRTEDFFCFADWDLLEGIKTVAADAHRLPYPDCSLDAVWSGQLLYRCHVAFVIEEIKRVLKPGGVWVGLENATPHTTTALSEFQDRYQNQGRRGDPVSFSQWKKVARQNGLVLQFVPGKRLRSQWLRRMISLWRPVHVTLIYRKEQ